MERKPIKLKEGTKDMSIDEVYEQFKNFIYKSCQSWTRQYEFDDLHQIASIGLTKAYNSYDINKEILFITYSSRIIQNEILMYNRKNRDSNLSESLNKEISGSDGSSVELQELIADDVNYENVAIKNMQLKRLGGLIDTLNERDKLVLTGISFKGKSQHQLAKELNLSQPCISRIYDKALEKMKIKLEGEKVRNEAKITREQLLKECLVLGIDKDAQKTIANKYGYSSYLTIANYIVSMGIKKDIIKIAKEKGQDIECDFRKSHRKITKEQLLEECKIHGSTWSSAKIIAKKYDLSYTTIVNYIRIMGVKEELNNQKETIQEPEDILQGTASEYEITVKEPVVNIESKCRLKHILQGTVAKYEMSQDIVSINVNDGKLTLNKMDLKEFIMELQELDNTI